MSSRSSAPPTAPRRPSWSCPLQATGMSGMETGLINLLEPGDVAIVGASGFFGRRIAEVARLTGAEVVEVRGRARRARSERAAARRAGRSIPAPGCSPSSTPRPQPVSRHPLAELGEAMRDSDTLLFADCVTSLGGIELEFDTWGIDYAYSCTQKCLGAPPGMSPLAVPSARCTGSGPARRRCRSPSTCVRLEQYWVKRPIVYHHTCPILHIYALHAALREVMLEGLEARWARHAAGGRTPSERDPRARHGPARRARFPAARS